MTEAKHDIVERLRIRAQWEFAAKEHNPKDHIDWQAADEIERLRKLVEEYCPHRLEGK